MALISTLDTAERRTLLRDARLSELFNVIGWDNLRTAFPVVVDNTIYPLSPVAQKRGVEVYECAPCADGTIPEGKIRRRIDAELTKVKREHLLIFVNKKRTEQVWMWTNREPGKPAFVREVPFHSKQSGTALLQILDKIAITVEEEHVVTLFDVLERVKDALQKETVTRNFYREFESQHNAFLDLVKGVDTPENRRWYTSVMINRIMFLYFVQSKRFLDDKPRFLQEHLADSKGNYYSDFLCPLFFQGLAKREAERAEPYKTQFGKIPYLQGSLFTPHQIEEAQRGADGLLPFTIPNAAFAALFAFFDRWNWHLDERPLGDGNNINPDVLGYIFEKYINNKQMGAYYTKEDITEYIGKNTILPFVLDRVRERNAEAFTGAGAVWEKLTARPDDFIYPAVRHGATESLPEYIEAGIADVSKRTRWNETAPATHALPTEIWREVVARRARYAEVHAKLSGGDVRDVRDFVTLNLDIRAFVQETLTQTESVDTIKAFWNVLNGVVGQTLPLSVLDPTCGSGAFLFAALEILRPMYTACLDRMEGFVFDADQLKKPQAHADFRRILADCAAHPNRDYFLLKRIVTQNLFGVDIMEEATEICKLRLFLKLAAQVEPDFEAENLGIEPLPDIDFNIRAGNTLVGAATEKQMETAFGIVPGKLAITNDAEDAAWKEYKEKLNAYDTQFRLFLAAQTQEQSSGYIATVKRGVNERLAPLRERANEVYARTSYGIIGDSEAVKARLATWAQSHKPFHWFVEFHAAIERGGFDVIIGNPPYLETNEVDYSIRGFKSEDTGAIHAMCMERAMNILHPTGAVSMIVPLSLVSTQRMRTVQGIIEEGHDTWYTNYSWRPGKLFDTVNRALTIFTAMRAGDKADTGQVYTTPYQKWNTEGRDLLIVDIPYVRADSPRNVFWVPKVGEPIEADLLEKMKAIKSLVSHFVGRTQNKVYYRCGGGLYWKVFTDFAPAFNVNGVAGHSTRETKLTIANAKHVVPIVAVLSSNTFWWWYTVTSNCRDLNPYDVVNFPVPKSALDDAGLVALGRAYLDDITKKSMMATRVQKQTGTTQTQSFKINKSKPIIDEIDHVLAAHYGFTDEELDFVINYDIKYRMGRGAGDGGENDEQ